MFPLDYQNHIVGISLRICAWVSLPSVCICNQIPPFLVVLGIFNSVKWNAAHCRYIDLDTGTSFCLDSGNGSCGDFWLLSYPISTLFFGLMKWKCYSYDNPYSPQGAVKESVNEQISLPYPMSVENKESCGIQLAGEFMEYYCLSEF